MSAAALRFFPLFHGCSECPDRFAPLRERLQRDPVPEFPIDLIYTWVDGSDPVWLEQRRRFSSGDPDEEQGKPDPAGALYQDNEELRYSLRSVESFVPWIRRVVIATAGQTPAWLRTEHPKVQMADHREFIPAEYLPTFNSHVIEAFLHRIPQLGRHYLYCNDDVFFAAPSRPGDFFTANGLPYIFTDWKAYRRRVYARADTPHRASYANVQAYLRGRGVSVPEGLLAAHIPFAQTRSNAEAAALFFREPIASFAGNRFRSLKDMAFYCHALPLWSYATRRAVPCDAVHYYINAKRPDCPRCYEMLLRDKGTEFAPLSFCINEAAESHASFAWRDEMRRFLRAYYPRPSSFEIDFGKR